MKKQNKINLARYVKCHQHLKTRICADCNKIIECEILVDWAFEEEKEIRKYIKEIIKQKIKQG